MKFTSPRAWVERFSQSWKIDKNANTEKIIGRIQTERVFMTSKFRLSRLFICLRVAIPNNIRRQTIGSTPINVERQNPITLIIGKNKYTKITSVLFLLKLSVISVDSKTRQERNKPAVRRSKYAPVMAYGVSITKYPPTKTKINAKFMKDRKRYTRSDDFMR